MKEVFREKYRAINTSIKKEERSQIKYLAFYLKTLGKEQTKPNRVEVKE